MNVATASLEQRLRERYEEQQRHYDRALASIAQPPAEEDDAWLTDVTAALHQVAAIDVALTADREAWRQARLPPGPALRLVLARLAETIRTLHERVDHHMAQIQHRRQQLVPELDAVVRQQQMLQAYRDGGRS